MFPTIAFRLSGSHSRGRYTQNLLKHMLHPSTHINFRSGDPSKERFDRNFHTSWSPSWPGFAAYNLRHHFHGLQGMVFLCIRYTLWYTVWFFNGKWYGKRERGMVWQSRYSDSIRKVVDPLWGCSIFAHHTLSSLYNYIINTTHAIQTLRSAHMFSVHTCFVWF